ncbi:ThiF family adenylyltransferase [Brevibacillus nitrificans]|uniref:HesA/MoeB/ThiF family protein n=1 Tax=Brevibacillus nitrificans TaxID=651560 RepID=UPI0028599295|nr:ThiF family adenylyltransferase [Brevibacillus nitrificans]MDR7313771.1 bacteriocin biosynthesis cyclodehydratase domain-containing protein [Brevibacillus nitrificans]
MKANRYLTLQGSWRYRKLDNGTEFSSVILQRRFCLKGMAPELIEGVLSRLKKGVAAEEAHIELAHKIGSNPETVNQLIMLLMKNNVILEIPAEELTPQDKGLYDRQILFYNLYETQQISGTDLNSQLQKRKVVIVGLGGYGTWMLLHLARIGIRHIVGIDPDVVELTNLNRQVLYKQSDIGSMKIDACRRSIAEIDPDIYFEGHAVHIHSPQDLIQYLDGADLVFNAFGYCPTDMPQFLPTRHVAQACIDKQIPSLLYNGSWVGPLHVPGVSACYWCLMSIPEIAEAARASIPESIDRRRALPAFAPRVAMAANIAAWEASRFLSKTERPPSMDHLITFDTFSYQSSKLIRVPKRDDCPVCCGKPNILSESIRGMTEFGIND